MIITLASSKGGVGKSTITGCLAGVWAADGDAVRKIPWRSSFWRHVGPECAAWGWHCNIGGPPSVEPTHQESGTSWIMFLLCGGGTDSLVCE